MPMPAVELPVTVLVVFRGGLACRARVVGRREDAEWITNALRRPPCVRQLKL